MKYLFLPKINVLKVAVAVLFIFPARMSFSQEKELPKPPKHPSAKMLTLSTGDAIIDNYIVDCYKLYSSVKQTSDQLDAIEQQVLKSPIADINANAAYQQLTGFSSGLSTSIPNATDLVSSGAAMLSRVKDVTKDRPLRLPQYILAIKNATIYAKYSLEKMTYSLGVTIPNVKEKIKPGTSGGDSALAKIPDAQKPVSNNQPVADNAQTLHTSIITIKNISYVQMKVFADSLKSSTVIKDFKPAFSNNTATINLTHTCTTEALLDYFMKASYASKFDVIRFEEGKIEMNYKN